MSPTSSKTPSDLHSVSLVPLMSKLSDANRSAFAKASNPLESCGCPTVHTLHPPFTCMAVANPLQSMCQVWKAPPVAASPQDTSPAGGAADALQLTRIASTATMFDAREDGVIFARPILGNGISSALSTLPSGFDASLASWPNVPSRIRSFWFPEIETD